MTRSGKPKRTAVNSPLAERLEQPVVWLDIVPIANGSEIDLEFLKVRSAWRQGVWIGTEGELEVNEVRSDQLTLWTDTAPRFVTVHCVLTLDGPLRLYNVWDSGRGYSRESLRATSGMLKEAGEDDWAVYNCHDIGEVANIGDFTKLVFALRVRQP